MRKTITFLLAVLFCMSAVIFSGCSDGREDSTEAVSLWDFEALSAVDPEVTDAGYTYSGNDNIKAIYFEGAEYNGEPTKIFAYYGIPETEMPENGYPAMVLVHGGLGMAFPDWVKLWTDRGYAAIALSVDANITKEGTLTAEANPEGGPNITITAADMLNPENSWIYISVANIIYCNNILRADERIDESNIGITGISWGSYLTCITVGVDNRFKFGIPVYGAGYNDEDVTSSIGSVFALDDASLEIYREKFDPSVYMKNCEIPLMWFAGADDHAFSLDCNQRCADLSKGDNYFSWRSHLVHGQQPGDGTGLPEIFLFADRIVHGTDDEILRIDEGTMNGDTITVNIQNDVGVKNAYLYYSSNPLELWHSANIWNEAEAAVSGNTVTASKPADALYAFVQITDEFGNIVSSRCFAL